MLICNVGNGRYQGGNINLDMKETVNVPNEVGKSMLHNQNILQQIDYRYYKANDKQCPVCFVNHQGRTKQKQYHINDIYQYDCPRCGKFLINDYLLQDGFMALSKDRSEIRLDEEKRAYLSNLIRKKNIFDKELFSLSQQKIQEIFENFSGNSELQISINDRINNLISFLANQSKELGDVITKSFLELEAVIGVNAIYSSQLTDTFQGNISGSGPVIEILKHLKKQNLVSNGVKTGDGIKLILTIEGYEYFENLKRLEANSDTAFFAFAFPRASTANLDSEFEEFREECAKQLEEIGIKLLNPLLFEPKNGNITNRLEIEIIKSKFLVADLSHDNSGAYWEAGFAHGLGKKVFYTCKKDKKIKPHFDVNQHYVIFWTKKTIKEDAKKLKEAIERSFL